MVKSDRFRLTKDAIENYGEQYKDRVFVVTAAANKYMPAAEFFEKGSPGGYHPGYDEGVSPQKLYDFKDANTNEEMHFSVYDWEVRRL